MVVDVVGTLDECRFTYDGLQVSKEITRQFYRKTDWYSEVEWSKKRAEIEGVQDWRKLCQTNPPNLSPVLKTVISGLYKAAANELTNRKMFDVPPLDEVTRKVEIIQA